MKIVLDTNVLLSSLSKRSLLRPIWESFTDGIFSIIVSEDILKEYEEILIQYAAPRASEIIMEIFIESPDIIVQNVFYNWNAIEADSDDNKFFDIAVAADADYLVTNDKHFDVAKTIKFPKVNIISAREFLDILQRNL